MHFFVAIQAVPRQKFLRFARTTHEKVAQSRTTMLISAVIYYIIYGSMMEFCPISR